MDDETFDDNKFIIRAFLHAFGRDTNQGEVLAEFGSAAFFIGSSRKKVGERLGNMSK